MSSDQQAEGAGYRLELAEGGPGVVRAPLLLRPALAHAFTTRRGGVAGDLDFGGPVERVARDTAALARRVGFDPSRLFRLRQVHSARVVVVGPDDDPAAVGAIEADALVTGEPGATLAVQTADCVPVLLHDCEGRAVAAAHAGWRGLVGGVLEATVSAIAERFGGRPPALRAAIGPCVCVDCYEVSPSVAARFAHLPGVVRGAKGARPHVDLPLAARRILVGLGLTDPAVAAVPLCTACRGDLFFSYRRDGARAGRQLSLIGIESVSSFASGRASVLNQ